MKKYLLLLLLASFSVDAQIVNIPDANFKARLLQASSSNLIASTDTPDSFGQVNTYHTIDTNGDGEIQVSEAQTIKWLRVSGFSISNLTGLEDFVNLIALRCGNNQLTSLDITQNPNLLYLNCNYNQLTSINLTQNPNLLYLYCDNNQLPSLDVTHNPNLQILLCFVNQLISLDVTQNPNLQDLHCNFNQLTSLDVTQNPNLYSLYCYNNQLMSLDVTQNPNLTHLYCEYNELTNIDVTQNPILQYFYCIHNELSTLDLTQNPNLQYWSCSNNELISLFIKNSYISNINNLNFGNNPNLTYVCADDAEINAVQQRINSYGYTNCHANSYCSFTLGGAYYEIVGNTKLDFDNNGCDVNDLAYSNLKFNLTNNGNITGYFITNSTGNYAIPVQTGTHTITPVLENPSYFTISPASISVGFPSQASPFTQDFCFTPNGNHSDVEITIIPITPARPGFDADYKIVYKNKGNQLENGTVTFSIYNPEVVDFISSIPNFDLQTNAPNIETFTWSYSNLLPFETRDINIVLNLNSPQETPALNGGEILEFIAIVDPLSGDEMPSDNTSTLNQEVVNSYDPNDKTCLEGSVVSTELIGQYVHYVIRFENTGTFFAQNVVVKDEIDLSKFDLNSLIVLNASHQQWTRINGNKVEFIFENIQLPFPPSEDRHGYVAFKIKLKNNLTVGDTFSNFASIYFDYNFPIITEPATTTIEALSNPDFEFSNFVKLYPNPASSTITIESQRINLKSVEIFNSLGQLVQAIPNENNQLNIDVSNLQTGTYFVKVYSDKGVGVSKFVKQ
ncbi:T9SS type A sorting domain-containing protein [Flavobacterium sp.]|uniref:T9SS type A sorting domain-containing protein n=1 Tax=Flavobacterium sp. TaxID=239 RepID=UPI00352735FF